MRLDFDTISEHCRDSCFEVPESANRIFRLALSGSYSIAEREGIIQKENAALVAIELILKERDMAFEEIVKLQTIVDASGQRPGAQEERALKLAIGRDVLLHNCQLRVLLPQAI